MDSTWTYVHATGNTYRIVLRTAVGEVGYRQVGGSVRIHVRTPGGIIASSDAAMIPAPFSNKGNYASCTVAVTDARAVIHRAVDWLLKRGGFAALVTAPQPIKGAEAP